MENHQWNKSRYDWNDVVGIIEKLRSPQGCPWDRVQTYQSMKKCVMDEAQEVIEAVENEDFINLREELGDLMLQVLIYSDIAASRGEFTLEDVIDELGKKLIRRHPHVFSDQKADTQEEGLQIWNQVKAEEKKNRLKEYEAMYEQGRISQELLEFQRAKLQKKTGENPQ